MTSQLIALITPFTSEDIFYSPLMTSQMHLMINHNIHVNKVKTLGQTLWK